MPQYAFLGHLRVNFRVTLSRFIPKSVFYTQSVTFSPRFIPSWVLVLFAVRSPQSAVLTFLIICIKIFFESALRPRILLVSSSHVSISLLMHTIKAIFCRTGYHRSFKWSLRVLFIHQLTVLFWSHPRRITQEASIKVLTGKKYQEISGINKYWYLQLRLRTCWSYAESGSHFSEKRTRLKFQVHHST